jgi:hypothetical protein
MDGNVQEDAVDVSGLGYWGVSFRVSRLGLHFICWGPGQGREFLCITTRKYKRRAI